MLRGADVPDGLPGRERRVDAEIVEQYGSEAVLTEVAQRWRPYRTWAVVHLRALREQRTREIGGPQPAP